MSSRITLPQGDTMRRRFLATDGVTGKVVNLTGFEVEFEVKRADDDPDPPLVARQVGNGITILDQTVGGLTEGFVEVQLDPVDTRDLVPDTYRYDVVWVETDQDRFHFQDTPADFVVVGVVNQADGAGQPIVPGQPASQSEQERTFSFSWPALIGTAVVPIPGSGMFRATYFVGYEYEGTPALVGILAFDSKTSTGFDAVVQGGGSLLPGTVINFLVRDQA